MPALIATDFHAEITWLGVVVHRQEVEVETDMRTNLTLDWDGVPDGAHSGRTRPSDSRVLQQHSRGTEIANVRQVTLVSQEDIDAISSAMELTDFDPRWLGANVVVKGLPDFSNIPPSSRLQTENGTTLAVDMQNFPCHQIGKTIELDRPGLGKTFKQHAKERRGVTAYVERPGNLTLGDKFTLHIPQQRAWAGHDLRV